MRRRHGDQDALLADGHDAQAVHHGDALEPVFGPQGGGDGHHGAQGQGLVGGVLEFLDGFVVEGVAGCACGLFCGMVSLFVARLGEEVLGG